MARHAANAFVYVDTVVEINKIGKVMNPHPGKRFPGAKAFPYRLEDRAIGPDLSVTGHAGFGGRKARDRRFLDIDMTVPAVDPDTTDVVLMAKGYRLLTHHAGFCHVGRARHGETDPAQSGEDKYSPKNT
jgi:hypothetical protein